MIIDNLDNSSGWTSSDSTKISIHAINQIPEYIANKNSASLIIHIKPNSKGAYIEKTITSVDSSVYDYGSIHYVALRSKDSSFYPYKGQKVSIAFNTTMNQLLLKNYNTLAPNLFSTANIGTMDRIRITSLSDDEDYIIISSLSLNKDEIPLNIYTSVKAELESIITSHYGDGIKIATLTGLTGDTEVVFGGDKYFMQKYAVIKIKDDTNSEIHMLSDNDETLFRFDPNYEDGEALLHDYDGADVYLQFPVGYELREEEVILPGIAIQTDTPQEVLRQSKIEHKFDTFDDQGGADRKLDDQLYEWSVTLECEARQPELIQRLSKICRDFIARNYLWMNNKKYYITFGEPSFMTRPIESYNEVPRLEYNFKIENYEEIWARETLPLADAVTDTITIGG